MEKDRHRIRNITEAKVQIAVLEYLQLLVTDCVDVVWGGVSRVV